MNFCNLNLLGIKTNLLINMDKVTRICLSPVNDAECKISIVYESDDDKDTFNLSYADGEKIFSGFVNHVVKGE